MMTADFLTIIKSFISKNNPITRNPLISPIPPYTIKGSYILLDFLD